MKASDFFISGDSMIAAEAIWKSLDPSKRLQALRMLKNGDLQAEGRLVREEFLDSHDPPTGSINVISREDWSDMYEASWIEEYSLVEKLTLLNLAQSIQYCEISIRNSETLRDLVELERLVISAEDFDMMLFNTLGTKVGAKAWACAAAALASSHVKPTATALARHLRENPDVWTNGPANERNLIEYLGPLVAEFKRLTGID